MRGIKFSYRAPMKAFTILNGVARSTGYQALEEVYQQFEDFLLKQNLKLYQGLGAWKITQESVPMGGTHLPFWLSVRSYSIMRWQLPLCWCFCGSENQLRKTTAWHPGPARPHAQKIIPNVLKGGLTPVAESAMVLPE